MHKTIKHSLMLLDISCSPCKSYKHICFLQILIVGNIVSFICEKFNPLPEMTKEIEKLLTTPLA